MIKDLVTVLTPAYNGEHLIFRLLDSVLCQTYPNIHMIVVNDGSTDATSDIVKSYIPRFEKRGLSLTLYEQANGGLSNTINNGLKHVDGEFLVWPDIDDWYATTDAIEKLVKALKNYGDDVAVSRCAYNRVLEDNMQLLRIDYPLMGDKPQNIFDKAILGGKGFWFVPGGWMIKTKFLDTFIPGREIYQSKLTGQNTQLLWPYLYAKKCISVEEPLFTCLIRTTSHSRGLFADLDKKLLQQDEYIKTYRTVLEHIDGLSPVKAEQLLFKRIAGILKDKVRICIEAKCYKRSMQLHKDYISYLRRNNAVSITSHIAYIVMFIKCAIKHWLK